MKARVWKAYLPIKIYRGKIAPGDVAFFAQRGIGEKQLRGALGTLRHMRRDVLKLFRTSIEKANVLDIGIHVHEIDKKPCIDVDLIFAAPVDARKMFAKPWRTKSRETASTEIAGVDIDSMKHGYLAALSAMTHQSWWYLGLIERYKDSVSDVDLLKQIGQYLHYFANMAQIPVT